MSGIHLIFDLIAAGSAAAVTIFVYRRRIRGSFADPGERISATYLSMLILGVVVGGYGFGTANLWLSGQHEIGRSVLGALAGGIAAVEFHKWLRGIHGSTGLVFVCGLATTVAVGRIGCLLSGLEDQTFGNPTGKEWGWDFGDGVPRHPVQLYESLAMAVFLTIFLPAVWRRRPAVLRNGFYLFVAVYALQRFFWEFLKPYAAVLGPLNVFHVLCLALFGYAVFMMAGKGRKQHALK